MPFGRIEEDLTRPAEWQREGELLGFIAQTASWKEKVARHFEQWREPVFRYLVAAFGPAAQAITAANWLAFTRSIASW